MNREDCIAFIRTIVGPAVAAGLTDALIDLALQAAKDADDAYDHWGAASEAVSLYAMQALGADSVVRVESEGTSFTMTKADLDALADRLLARSTRPRRPRIAIVDFARYGDASPVVRGLL